ncbi:putative pre-rrna processing protein utp22 protein [Coleophoma crateriformis]|uniref:U3 small nucleolar RNA-associated protein 22 n=1 Tax=Coleophoma crateriformis TaxID=565419 RepID=A0A3D8RIG5_9HELO|nr:putative pre-rrna processing protein utp22 protein [Coleophoma crateriformis]
MAVNPSKRRKLDHEIQEDSSNEAESKQVSKTKSARLTNHEDGALYSGGSYKSNLFKLQVDEMLAEVKPNYEKRLGFISDELHKLKGLIESIGDRDPLSVQDAMKAFRSCNITIPFPDPKPSLDAAYKLSYARPSKINVSGSYATKTMIKSDSTISIDLIVTMPPSIFQDKDYLNYRYFYKRAYYLACIAAGLQTGENKLEYEYKNGNKLHPILVLNSKAKPGHVTEIHILLAAPEGLFAESKLRPERNAIRNKETIDSESFASVHTPFYNASLRSDCCVESYLKLLHGSSKQSSAFKDSCILGRIWLRQRGFGSSLAAGGFGTFEWSALIALLLRTGGPQKRALLSSGYSSYQIFKAVLHFLSTTDLLKRPLVLETDFLAAKLGLPMIYDGQRGHNILYKMTPWSYDLLRQEAATTSKMLNDSTFDYFEPTFIIRTNHLLHRFDCIVRLEVPESEVTKTLCDAVSGTRNFSLRLYDMLKEGLMDRVTLIHLRETVPERWPLKSPSTTANEQELVISVIFNPANVDRLVDHGPSAEDKKAAAKFQKFWGEKAELRRFKDGSILESLVWPAGSSYSIYQNIVTFLIGRHFGADAIASLEFVGEAFSKALPTFLTSGQLFEALRQDFQKLERDIRNLEDLPLQLRQLSAISPSLRNSSIHPPSFSTLRPLADPADVAIQFEGSGRWPDDIEAIQRTKIAFLLKIGSCLEETNAEIISRIGLENDRQALQNCAFLDIFYPSGAAFRLRIQNDREQTLLERQIKGTVEDHRARTDAVAALAYYKRLFIHLPLLNQSIATHCTRFPFLSPTIRLVKMWFDRHLLSEHFSEEFIELLAAHVFLHPMPWNAPSSAMTGFLRVLFFLSRWDWRLVPLIVDFTGTMTSSDAATINTRLEAWRKVDPSMNRTVLFAATNHDTTGTAFTSNGPTKVAAARMTALARSACKIVKEHGISLDYKTLFATSLDDYDFVIHLNPKYSKTFKELSASKQFKNLEVQSNVDLELVGLDSVETYVHEIQERYGETVVFFRSKTGTVVAGLWNPQYGPRSFKVNLSYATRPLAVGDDQEIVGIDKSTMLAEISRIGGDMVMKIEVR